MMENIIWNTKKIIAPATMKTIIKVMAKAGVTAETITKPDWGGE